MSSCIFTPPSSEASYATTFVEVVALLLPRLQWLPYRTSKATNPPQGRTPFHRISGSGEANLRAGSTLIEVCQSGRSGIIGEGSRSNASGEGNTLPGRILVEVSRSGGLALHSASVSPARMSPASMPSASMFPSSTSRASMQTHHGLALHLASMSPTRTSPASMSLASIFPKIISRASTQTHHG